MLLGARTAAWCGGGGGENPPAGYTKVTAIASDGIAYIDTGIYFENGDNLNLEFASTSTGDKKFFGAFYWSMSNSGLVISQTSDGYWRYAGSGRSWTSTGKPVIISERTKFVVENGLLTITDSASTNSVPLQIVSNNEISIGIFGQNNRDYFNAGASVFYLIEIVGRLRCVPVIRDSDSKPGFWDFVGERFVTKTSPNGTLTAII